MLTRRTRALSPLLVLVFAACEEGEVVCDTSASASVTVTVVDADGAAVSGEAVTWSADGGEFAACDGLGDTWACGWEVAGTLTVRVEAEGFLAAEEVVHITQGTCHVDQQQITVQLEPEAGDSGDSGV